MMKKFTFTILIIILFSGFLPELKAQDIQFEDSNFKQALLDAGTNITGNNEISYDEAILITYLKIYCKGITDLREIEYFTRLVVLNCSRNSLEYLDISKNIALVYLDSYAKKFLLSVIYDLLSYEIVDFNTSAIRIFTVHTVNLSFEVDYSSEVLIGGEASTFEWYDSNNIAAEDDVVKRQGDNGIFYCKISNSEALKYRTRNTSYIMITNDLILDDNFKEAENIYGSLDISSQSIGNLEGIQYFINITELYCKGNLIDTLDVSSNTQLEKLYCANNLLSSLNVSQNTELQIFSVSTPTQRIMKSISNSGST